MLRLGNRVGVVLVDIIGSWLCSLSVDYKPWNGISNQFDKLTSSRPSQIHFIGGFV